MRALSKGLPRKWKWEPHFPKRVQILAQFYRVGRVAARALRGE